MVHCPALFLLCLKAGHPEARARGSSAAVVVVVVVVVVLGRVYFLPVLPWPVEQKAQQAVLTGFRYAGVRPRTVRTPRDCHKLGPAPLSQPGAPLALISFAS